MDYCLNLIKDLQNLIMCKAELKAVMININNCIDNTYQGCLESLNIIENVPNEEKLKIESILDYLHDELNTGHWSEISLNVRRAFTAASFVKSIILLRSATLCTENVLEECLKCLDMGLLLGAPLEDNPDLLTDCASFVSKKINEISSSKNKNNFQRNIIGEKRKLSQESFNEFKSVKGIDVDVLSCPSLEAFNNNYFIKQVPVKLQDCMSHWPASNKWTNLDYLLKIAGDRTVPVEIGSHYVDENWSQKLMTLKDFIKNYFLAESDDTEYCCLGEEENDPDINAWFGPAGTVSPLHFDPKNNILAQVFGTKQIILYSPNDNTYLYPHEGPMLSNTAQVNPFSPDVQKYPNFCKANAYKCLLEPGEMLYIPPKWWHHVTALDKSFSVSFWWN